MIPDGNLCLHKGMKRSRSDKYMGKYKRHFLALNFFLNDGGGIKTKILIWVGFMGYVEEIKLRTTTAQVGRWETGKSEVLI